jgi:hypothetical protein
MNHEPTTLIWSFNRTLTQRLLFWAILSVLGGLLLQLSGRPFLKGVGAQAFGWGVIDAAIALAGQRSAERKQITATPLVEVQHARSLRRLLWLNAGLDVGYMAGGLWLARAKGRANAVWAGHGWGIVIQGAFLFVFDLVHALRVPSQESRG